MPIISVDLAESLAPAPSALENAKSLLRKKAIEGMTKTADGSLVFASCQGSGKQPYSISADLSRPEKPVLRCSCPSRQLPCKHAIALMLAYASGAAFAVGEAPPELLAKREQAEKREKKAEEKRAEEPAEKPKKVNAGALHKKIEIQVEGLEALAATARRIGASGIGALTPEALDSLEAQAKRLGDAYLPGPQTLLRRFIQDAAAGEGSRTKAADELCLLRSLARKGIARCMERLADPEHRLDPESTMDEWLGHAWQLSELEAARLVRPGVELVQLSFAVHDDDVKKEYCDSGMWIDLSDGRIFETRNLRPYKALKHLKAEDSFWRVAAVPQLCVYPGGINPRARWDGMGDRDILPADLEKILVLAEPSLAEACKKARAQMKNALLPPCPVMLLRFATIGRTESEAALMDAEGSSIALRDGSGFPAATAGLLPLLPATRLSDGALLARFWRKGGRLFAQPLSIVGRRGILRLAW